MLPLESVQDLQKPSLLYSLANSGESQYLEFKSGLVSPRHLAILISSFANSEGGVILFGIGDNGEIVGIQDADQLEELLIKAIALLNPAVSGVESVIVELDGKIIGCIFVPSDLVSPIAVERNFYRRIGGQTRQYTKDEIEVVITDRQTPTQLFVTEAELENFITSVDEDTFTKILLVPLLRSLGFRSVIAKGHKDRSLEYGQDIRGFKLQLPTGHWLYFAAQVKVGHISYGASNPDKNIENILTQVAMAFNKKMYDVQTSSYHIPDNVFLVTSGDIAEGARQYLYERLSGERNRRILFWDSSLILETAFDKGLPKGMQLEIKRFLEQSNQSDESLFLTFDREIAPPERQQKVLEFLYDYIKKNSYAPTLREIGTGIGVSSTSLISYYLSWLEDREYISRESNTIRGIYLLPKASVWISRSNDKH